MAYLGNVPARSFISFERQVFTIVNSQTAYTLSHSVTNENDIRLVINNVVQEPGSGKAYTASGTTLTLSAALTNGTDEMYCVFLGKAVGTVNPPAGSVDTAQLAADAVTEAKIADGAVESEHLNNNVISGQTELAVAPASTDELLISDGGVLKRIDVSLVGGDNTPYFQGRLNANQSVSNGSGTIIQLTAAIDTASGWDSSTYKWTVPSGQDGNYFVSVVIDGQSSSSNNTSWVNCSILKNSDVGLAASDNKSMTSNAGGRHVMTNSVSGIVALTAGDEVYFQGSVYINSGTAQFNGSSSVIVTGGTIIKLIGS